MSESEISALRDELHALRAEVAALQANSSEASSLTTAGPAPTSNLVTAVANQNQLDSALSRRKALRTAGVIAAGALAGGASLVSAADPASATGPATFDADANSPGVTASSLTNQEAIKATATSDRGVAIKADASGADYSVGVHGQALGHGSSTGVMGSASAGRGILGQSSTGIGVLGSSGTNWAIVGLSNTDVAIRAQGGTSGVHTEGAQSALRMDAIDFTPTASGITYSAGELTPGPGDVLWYCVEAGAPGKWRTLAAPNSAGSFYAVTPSRVYDSRVGSYSPNGVLGSGQNRTLSVANSYNTAGALVTTNFVPAGATSVFANVTVVETTGSGWLAINPGGIIAISASTINWSSNGQTLANGIALTLNDSREITVVNGSPGSTHFIIDITGYWM